MYIHDYYRVLSYNSKTNSTRLSVDCQLSVSGAYLEVLHQHLLLGEFIHQDRVLGRWLHTVTGGQGHRLLQLRLTTPPYNVTTVSSLPLTAQCHHIQCHHSPLQHNVTTHTVSRHNPWTHNVTRHSLMTPPTDTQCHQTYSLPYRHTQCQ